MRPLTQDDFIIKEFNWTKISRFALTKDGVLLRYDGKKTGFPFYMCLFDGYWEATDVGIGISEIAEARPISTLEAKDIIRKQAKPRSTRPSYRNNWVS